MPYFRAFDLDAPATTIILLYAGDVSKTTVLSLYFVHRIKPHKNCHLSQCFFPEFRQPSFVVLQPCIVLRPAGFLRTQAVFYCVRNTRQTGDEIKRLTGQIHAPLNPARIAEHYCIFLRGGTIVITGQIFPSQASTWTKDKKNRLVIELWRFQELSVLFYVKTYRVLFFPFARPSVVVCLGVRSRSKELDSHGHDIRSSLLLVSVSTRKIEWSQFG